jgi:hypothetical protein
MEKTVIAWNIPNWITIFLMSAAGYLAIAIVAQFVIGGSGGQSQTATTANGGASNG